MLTLTHWLFSNTGEVEGFTDFKADEMADLVLLIDTGRPWELYVGCMVIRGALLTVMAQGRGMYCLDDAITYDVFCTRLHTFPALEGSVLIPF